VTIEQDTRRATRDGQADFDFLIGSWRVRNRRRTRPRGDLDAWEEFDASAVVRPLWGGRANVDEFEGQSLSGPVRGLTLRLYDPAARQWSLYWASGRAGRLDRPVVGEFRDGRGEFFDQDLVDGRTVLVRYVWSDITETSCRWEQAFSPDGGRTWDVDWVMDLTRTG
jgi:hypothetical protein